MRKMPKGAVYEAFVIGQHIRYLRRIKDLSQAHVAQRIGVSVGWIGRIERGLHMPNMVLLMKIATVLQVRVKDLVPAEL